MAQIACSVAATYFGSRTAMGFGRDLRAAIFRRVSEFSGREVVRFGAPSLITRNTNDVQQVQLLVALTATMMITAPIMSVGGIVMAVHEDPGLSWLMGVSVPLLGITVGLIIVRMVPQFRLMQTPFRVGAGEALAVVGSTGAGKATLMSLIPRPFDVRQGAVLVDGVDVRELGPDLLWARIGPVPQRPYLFSGTLASNLRYGNPQATDDELWEVLTVAQARDFVEAMPAQLAAPIAQGGTNVSGGQRQRLAVARALVRAPEIYLFDESSPPSTSEPTRGCARRLDR